MFYGTDVLLGHAASLPRKRLWRAATAQTRRGFAAFLLLAGPLAGPLWGAEDGAHKPVRIAFQEFNRQMIVDEANKPVSGYAYEYIQTVGTYAGWDIQYVPCSSFADSLRLLRAGTVDLAYEISYTEERAKEMLFPEEPMGVEYYYLYSTEDNTSIFPDDVASMNGRTVGVTSGTTLPALLKEWSRKKNIDFNVVEYESIFQKEADLYAGKIDLDLELSMLAKKNLSAVERIGSSTYFLVANTNRQDLVDDINSATEVLLNNDLFFFSRLQERYFADTVLSRNLTSKEKKWLDGHKTLRVGYFDDYLPFSCKDADGNPTGSCVDVLRKIFALLNLGEKLELAFTCFDNQEKGFRAVESGAIDLMIPAYISRSVRQKYHVVGSKPLAEVEIDLAFRDNYGDGKNKRLGVNRNNLMQQFYCRDIFPESKLVFFDSIGRCLDGILGGRADGTFLNGFRTDALLKPAKYHSLRTVRATQDFSLHMAFAEDNIGLVLLMNRGLALLPPDFIDNASHSYLGEIYSFSPRDFIQDHLLPVILLVAALVALVVAMADYFIRNRRLEEANRSLVRNAGIIDRQRRQEAELRKQLEKQQDELRLALQMAQSANQAKTAFLSNMSHDIRTPMNAIIGFTDLAASNLGDTERVKDCLTTIAHSSEHLLSLINDVLDMSRIESGRMTMNEKQESLPEILQLLRDIVQPEIKARRHHFDIDVVNLRNEYIYCDKLRLNQILLNLLSNAIKYTEPGGTISLRVTQKSAPASGYATFEFRCSDNGIGMGKEFAKTIFEPFTREENSTVSAIRGTGLGMPIAKSIVDMMGGRIDVRSEKGKGSEFTVTVDFKVAETPRADARPPERASFHVSASGEDGTARQSAGAGKDGAEKRRSLLGRRLLLADDNDLNVKIGVLQFQQEGMAVDTARNGREAVELVRKNGPDAYDFVLMDLQMPVLDGYGATAEIRKLPGGDRLVILAYSANAFEEDRERSLKAGMNGHIAKPLRIEEVLKELDRFAS